jgi:hypothetical protein
MEIAKVVQELRRELHQVDEAILSLERMAVGAGKRRGRPPAWIAAAKDGPPVMARKRGRPPGARKTE